MRIHYIQHASFEEVGVIKDWSKARDFSLSGTHTYKGEILPDVESFDMLVIMGGPQGPDEVEEFPYLADEMTLIKQAIAADKHVIGFCLGAQLIGATLGAPVDRSPEKEIGVYPITLTKEGLRDPLFDDFGPAFPVIHWHNDMPGLADGATLLAHSAGCPRQAIRYRPKVYGLQFHMEITKDLMAGMIHQCPSDLAPSTYTQTAEQLLTQDYDSINQKMWAVLDRLMVL